MIDALIGAVIAVVATGALALLAEVMSNAQSTAKTGLTEYEKSVFNVVKSAHQTAASEDELLEWMQNAEKGRASGF